MLHKIGIRQENKDTTEKRAPLTPRQVRQLIEKDGLQVVVEPASNRIFGDQEYQDAGATISRDLSDCNIIFGVKEIPIPDFLPKQHYCFFSHTIKGQTYNMPMLKYILDLRTTLIDYEKVTDSQGRRLIFFGRFAGYAGMIDSLWAFGQRLQWEGIATPFSDIRQALHYHSLTEAKESVRAVGERIKAEGLPASLTPLTCGFAGYGHVSQGAQEIFDLLPVETILPGELEQFMKNENYTDKRVYKVVFKESDIVTPKSETAQFELQDYYDHPEKYIGRFESYLPHLTLLINGIYWEPRYPKLVTIKYLRRLFESGQISRLRVIGDITCDVEGSIECNLKATNSENPIYVYDPIQETIKDGYEGNGVVVLAVDKLPSELPREASQSFGEALLPFVPELASCNFGLPYEKLNIPAEFRRAVIAHYGFLTPDFKYLEKYIK